MLWLALAFYAVNAAKFPIKISPFRAWMLLAIPVSLLAGESINLINNVFKSLTRNFTKSKNAVIAVSLIVLITLGFGIYKTSFVPKYKVNTANWPPGGFWTSTEEIQGYMWFKDNVPSGSKVFTFSNNGVILGLDKYICHWCPDVREFQQTAINKTAQKTVSRLRNDRYQYIVVDGQAAKKFGQNETNTMIQGLANLGLQPLAQNNGFIIFRI